MSRSALVPDPPMPGDGTVGKYTLLRQLGRGGNGVVYEGEDSLLKRRVAIKFVAPARADNPNARDRFLREAQAAARLNHAHVVNILEICPFNDGYYLVLELMPGGSLDDRLRATGALPWIEATRAIRDACAGLTAAHAAGLIHRDVKPANLMVGADGRVKLADFGLATEAPPPDVENAVKRHGGVAGTPHYMSPEQCCGETLDERADVYSLGATYYALLTGQTPYDGSSWAEQARAHCFRAVPDPRRVNPNIPEGCSVIVGHAMAKEPVSRYPSAIAMANALSRLLVEEGVESSISVGDTPRGASLLGDGTDPIVPSIRHGLVGPAGGDGPRDYAEGDGVGRAVFLAGTAAAILLIVLLARHLLLSEPQQPAPSETLAPWPAEIAADGEVGLLAFAGDNRLVWTTGGKNGKVSSCRLGETVEESWSVALPEAVALAVAPDGATFAVASATEARVLLLHASTGQEKRVLTPLPNGTIRGLAFHPSGNLMAIGVTDTASDKGHQVMVLNLTTEASPILLRGLPAAIRCLQFAPPGGMLAAGLADGTIILWTTGAWEESRRVKMSDQPVVDLSFSPDGFQLVETASDRQREAFARIWDTRTGEPRQTYGPLPAAARGACVSMDGKLLIIGHPGGPLFVELATDKRLSTPPETDPPIHALALSRDGRRMWGAAGRTIRPWLLPRTE